MVNTCAFIEEARQESIDVVLGLADRKAAGAEIVVTGCMAERYGDELAAALPEVDAVAGFGVPVTLGRKAGRRAAPELRPAEPALAPRPRRRGPTSRSPRAATRRAGSAPSRASAAPSDRGRSTQILVEVDQLVAGGAQEIVLVAQDLASYGRDQGVGTKDIVPLVEAVRQPRRRGCGCSTCTRPSSPTGWSRRSSPPACRTSTSRCSTCRARCCAACAAGATASGSSDRIEGIRRAAPDAAFRSNFIVGYPGETESDHDQLLAFVDAAQLDWCGFFAYSQEDGTYAAGLDGAVPRSLVDERLAELRERQDAITAARRDELVGSVVEVLVDEPGVARSHREAPEIDGIITVPARARRRFHAPRSHHRRRGPRLLRRAAPAGDAMTAHFGPSALATPANLITIGRLVLTIPLLGMILDTGASWPALVLWIALCVTDGIDGYFARRQGTTRSGAFLDPLADKVLVLGAMAALVANDTFWWLPVAIIAVRELGIQAFRSYWGRRGLAVPASSLAKVKTVVQEVAVGFGLLPLTATDHRWVANTALGARRRAHRRQRRAVRRRGQSRRHDRRLPEVAVRAL